MPEYLSPGIYMEEVDKGPKPIEGVGTAMPIFIGLTEKAIEAGTNGRASKDILLQPALVTNWEQYVQKFGDFVKDAYLPHAVNGYFTNGGTRCYVMSVRTLGRARALLSKGNDPAQPTTQPQPGADPATKAGEDDPLTNPDLLKSKGNDSNPTSHKNAGGAGKGGSTGSTSSTGASSPPAISGVIAVYARQGWDSKAHNIWIDVSKGSDLKPSAAADGPRSTSFEIFAKLTQRAPGERDKEQTERVTVILTEVLKEKARPEDKRVVDRIAVSYKNNIAPRLIEVILEGESTSLETYVPDKAVNANLTRESDTKAEQATVLTGMAAVEKLDDVTMVVMPDAMSRMATDTDSTYEERVRASHTQLIDHCERMKDRVAILDVPLGKSALDAKNWRKDFTNFDSSYATLYYPWIEVTDPITKRAMMVPPSGHVAGIWARSDSTRGVHKAPANEVVRGITGVEYVMTKGEQDSLNPIGVNCIRNFPGMGIRVWGARTLTSNPSWRYINIRRLYNFVEKSIERGTQWVVFEPNDPRLWARVRRDVGAFLLGVWREGALFGLTPDEAYYVKCDAELNPPESRREGKLFVEIGMAPVYPAEFVIFRISQWAGPGSEG